MNSYRQFLVDAARIAMLLSLAASPSMLCAQSVSARPLITGVSHLSVYTTDAEKTEHFYVHDLGGVKRSDPQSPEGVRYYFNSTQFVEVLPMPSGDTSINRMDHVAFKTTSVENLRTYLTGHGIAVTEKIESGSDGSRWFTVEDPEGNKIEFVQPPAKPEPVAANSLSSHIIHVGFIVHSPEAEDAFFRNILGFRPYWHGGPNDISTQWISQQVPDGTDWLEYMVVSGPEKKGIPPSMSKDTLGVLDHFSLGVFNMEKSVNLLYEGDRLTAKHSPPQIGRDGKWQLNLYDPDGTRAEVMEFQPAVKPCCSPFTATSPTK